MIDDSDSKTLIEADTSTDNASKEYDMPERKDGFDSKLRQALTARLQAAPLDRLRHILDLASKN